MAPLSQDVGPDLVIAGAARSGTTQLAARLALHSAIDPCAVKEPNYFSREFHRGPEWYDAYFRPRRPGLFRMDASVSYTFPQHSEALQRLAASEPTLVVYVVRDPIARAVSHYLLYRYYFGHEKQPTFGEALRERSFYLDVSDYEHWLDRLRSALPEEGLLVTPFRAVTAVGDEVARTILGLLGAEEDLAVDEDRLQNHRNNVVTFRSEAVRRATRALRHSPIYPVVRRTLGPRLVNRIRGVLTEVPTMPSTQEALASCAADQHRDLEALRARVNERVIEVLTAQDRRLGLEWTPLWES